MNLAGKSGTVAKTITISTDKGTKMLLVKTIIGPPHAGSTAIRPTAGKTFSTAARQNLPASHRGRCHVTDSMAWISGLEDPKGNAHAPVKVFST
jgi:hypothetical protein